MTVFRIYITADHMVRVEGDSIDFTVDGGLKVEAEGKFVAAFDRYLYVLTGD